MNVREKNLRFLVGTTIGNSKLLFGLNYYRAEYKDKIIRPDSDCCIEGFQRSGSSFFLFLFRKKNKKAKIAHHTHAAEQVIRAVKYKLPTIVLIREPEEVIASLLAWDEKLKVKVALKAYICFHKRLLPYAKDMFIVSFEDVTEKPVDIVKELNARFDTNFTSPSFTKGTLEIYKRRILSRNETISSPLPTPEKDKAKDLLRRQIIGDSKLLEARKVFEKLYSLRHEF